MKIICQLRLSVRLSSGGISPLIELWFIAHWLVSHSSPVPTHAIIFCSQCFLMVLLRGLNLIHRRASVSQKVSKFHRIDFFWCLPKCHGLIINCGAIPERDLHFDNIVVPGKVNCWTHREDHCRSFVFNEDRFGDEMLAVIKTTWPLTPWHH